MLIYNLANFFILIGIPAPFLYLLRRVFTTKNRQFFTVKHI